MGDEGGNTKKRKLQRLSDDFEDDPEDGTENGHNTEQTESNGERAPIERPSDEEWNNMTAKQKRLFELRLKFNQARSQNHQLVIEENKRASEDKSEAYQRRRREWQAEQEK